MERIYVDFNTMMQDPAERVRLKDEAILTTLGETVMVVVYDETMEVEAAIELDAATNTWWARPDWLTKRDLDYA